ncbi:MULTISPECIES: glycoside hydrolase family 130 protein [unclassified Sphingomonas]|uniref:glycoside hydrolase family 130 protein n=1 Tax=unclassified Sphingomonas TaxID=196159 RepID=UPI00177EBD4D|nr:MULTISPECIES: glycoside hydrolase family 130 protein [unclassified Sphingomonas]MBD8552577.1 glycoside hydrolase family 130 protein [Sphingomonas sp. CFBP 8764]MBD8737464.1 glycoside hydrolase family 130 protein [Sphingomonas sp. CFBP 13706]
MTKRAHVDFYDVVLKPDPSRTVVRPFEPGYPKGFDTGPTRTDETVELIMSLDGQELQRQLTGVTASLDENHRDVDTTLLRRFGEMAHRISSAASFSPEQQRLIGAYFSQEYAYEAAALFNPSAVLHPDQTGLSDGAVRFVLSLRGVGEGHVSSVTFRTGTWTPGGKLTIDDPGSTSVPPIILPRDDDDGVVHLDCGGSRSISETVLFPTLPSQRQGIEDMRLVRFVENDGRVTYHGTYTAFSGAEARSELLSTTDFKSFEMRALSGEVASAKGMALFPRRIDGRYVTLGRQDNKNIWLNVSDDLLHWNSGVKLVEPRYPWEFVQMGNCGSPLEIDEGWLVLTHGVGTVRNYCIGACLLDKKDPSKLLARTPRPVIAPSPHERDGYVPNVVYSCGALLSERTLLLPYAVADSFSAFGSLSVDNLLACME